MRAIGIPELHWVDLLLSAVGCVGWLYISLAWRDRALILLNSTNIIILTLGLIRALK